MKSRKPSHSGVKCITAALGHRRADKYPSQTHRNIEVSPIVRSGWLPAPVTASRRG